MAKSKSSAPAVPGGQGVPGFVPKLKPSQPVAQLVGPGKKAHVESGPTSVAAYALLMADPLNAQVVGRPDSNNMATNVSRLRDVYDVNTNAAGCFAMAFNGSLSLGAAGATMTGSTAAWSGVGLVPSQFITQLQADNFGVRTLAYVVEWMPTLAATSAAGRACLSHYPVSSISTLPGGVVSTYFDDDSIDFSGIQLATTVVRPWLDNSFKDPAAEQDFLATVVLAGTGFPAVAQTVGQIVVTRIVEQLPKGTVLARHQATHTPCDPGACCQANNIVGRGVTFAAGATPSKDLARTTIQMLMRIAKHVKPYVKVGLDMATMLM